MKRAVRSVVSWLVVVAVMVMFSPMSKSFAAVANDEVTSVKLKEADGTSGQNTNSGSGVKTNHIQNGAVTAAKLGIVCPSGQYLQNNGSTWVCSVGTAGPQGVKGDTGAPGPQGPVGQMPHYSNVIVVAKNGGDFTDPFAAISSIADASATNPYLVKIMPGVYDVGSNTVTINSYVSIEGSGKGITIIKSNNGFGPLINIEAGSAIIRNLTIDVNSNTSESSIIRTNYGTSLYVNDTAMTISGSSYSMTGIGANGTAKLDNVSLDVTGPGIVSGMFSDSPSDLNNVSIKVSGGGIQTTGFGANRNISVLRNVSIDSSEHGLMVGGCQGACGVAGQANVIGSVIKGSSSSLIFPASTFTPILNILSSQVVGTIRTYGGIAKIRNCVDQNFDAILP